ncbi:MAG: putative toxin-antitoxin system toxin component, PIN family [Muribaculaceae bacterium]|nr:putative toxin-antitoxin system toxin component, PIN family [Muribaculaceae bacterium]
MQSDKIYAVIDTNVIVSAFYSKDGLSNPAVVINNVLSNNIIPLYNDEIIIEYEEVLLRSKFNFPPEVISKFISNIKMLGKSVTRKKSLEEDFPDPDDIVFYEVRMSVDDSYLVTGNQKHFPVKPFIVTPTQMVEILKERNLI